MRHLFILLVAVVFCSCSNKDEAVVDGIFHGSSGQLIMVEKLSPHGATIIDTLRTTKDGEFEFRIKFTDDNPIFVNVKMGDSFVPLLLSPGEDITLSAVGNVFNNYIVEGSSGSSKLKELSQTTVRHIRSLDSLIRLYEGALDADSQAALGAEYGRQYIALKRGVIRFVMSNPHSLASIVPLYQPLVGGRYIFDEPSDIVYFRSVADSLFKIYPTSPYVISLKADLERTNTLLAIDSTINSQIELGQTTNLPDITLKDAEGQMRSLSSLDGKVILLDFTSFEDLGLKARNREMVAIYEDFAPRGFEIFQVSIDTDKAKWISSVVDNRLRWISVNDFKGTSSPAITSFNVTKVPSNFLIDRLGNIVSKDVDVDNLRAALSELID